MICTFGLINRGKGLEYMIQAMPRIVAACPEAMYLIVGATHPQVKRQEGEVYRESLVAMAESLGVGDHVRFVNRFLSLADLSLYLQACDVFVTPYPGKDQIASGTLAYALAAGGQWSARRISMPKKCWPKGAASSCRLATAGRWPSATLRFLQDLPFRVETRYRAYEYAKPMVWPNVGRRYLEFFNRVARGDDATGFWSGPTTAKITDKADQYVQLN